MDGLDIRAGVRRAEPIISPVRKARIDLGRCVRAGGFWTMTLGLAALQALVQLVVFAFAPEGKAVFELWQDWSDRGGKIAGERPFGARLRGAEPVIPYMREAELDLAATLRTPPLWLLIAAFAVGIFVLGFGAQLLLGGDPTVPAVLVGFGLGDLAAGLGSAWLVGRAERREGREYFVRVEDGTHGGVLYR